jgi:hypothetical protein
MERIFLNIENALKAAPILPTAFGMLIGYLILTMTFGALGLIAAPISGFIANQISRYNHRLSDLETFSVSHSKRVLFVSKMSNFYNTHWMEFEKMNIDNLAKQAVEFLKSFNCSNDTIF